MNWRFYLILTLAACNSDSNESSNAVVENVSLTISDGATTFGCRAWLGLSPANDSFVVGVDLACSANGPRVGVDLVEGDSVDFFAETYVSPDEGVGVVYKNSAGEMIHRQVTLRAVSVEGQMQLEGLLGPVLVRDGEAVGGDTTTATMTAVGNWTFGCSPDGAQADPNLETQFCRDAVNQLELRSRFPEMVE